MVNAIAVREVGK